MERCSRIVWNKKVWTAFLVLHTEVNICGCNLYGKPSKKCQDRLNTIWEWYISGAMLDFPSQKAWKRKLWHLCRYTVPCHGTYAFFYCGWHFWRTSKKTKLAWKSLKIFLKMPIKTYFQKFNSWLEADLIWNQSWPWQIWNPCRDN